jgi:hypothetical protein
VIDERVEPVEQVDIALQPTLDHAGGAARLVGEVGAALAFHLPPEQEPREQGHRHGAGEGDQGNTLGPQVALHGP